MEEVQGIIEGIIFESKENGYVVAKLKQEYEFVTIVGYMPYIIESQKYKFEGKWVNHPQFGEQFEVKRYSEIIPNTLLGIEKYLSSGIISGIGPITAKKIVERFGEDTFNILDNNIEKLKEIPGIGRKKIISISKSYNKQKGIKNIMIFFQNYGVTPVQCIKIYKKYKENSIETVKKNPYILSEEIRGIGFKTSDKIAKSLGIEVNSPFRIKSGIKYIIDKFCNFGNVYIPLEKLIKEGIDILKVSVEDMEKNIYQSALEGSIKIETVEGKNCVFNLLYYYCELGVTKKILELMLNKYENIDIDIYKEIKNFEKRNFIKFDSSQKEAIEGAINNGIEIITGGPGTGKTTIINCITEIFEKANLKVLMGAPTGRAAKRMTEATGREAKTIHRLLELGVSDEQNMMFFKSESEPLECDVIIIDEASMIDIVLMNNFLKAVALGTRIIIVGDVDQLPSVGPGNVLRDLINTQYIKVVKLREIFRQSKESMIIVNAHRINNGEMPILNKKGMDFYFINCKMQEKILEVLIQLIDRRLPRYGNWDKMKDIQLLSPIRKGILGVFNLNRKLQNVLNPKSSNKKEKQFKNFIFRVGDKVMQTKNNYCIKWTRISGKGENKGIGIFNGDMGYIYDIDNENNTITAIFDEEKKVIYDNLSIDEIELAYGMTIHKSQGSEFPVVIMPVFKGIPLLMNRNLFYTGITRAKQLVVLVGDYKGIKFMINNNKCFERYSLLNWRILDILKEE